MSNIEIKYTFDIYGDKDEIELLMKYKNYYAALSDLQGFIRQKYKEDDSYTISIEELRTKFYEIIDENDANLNL